MTAMIMSKMMVIKWLTKLDPPFLVNGGCSCVYFVQAKGEEPSNTDFRITDKETHYFRMTGDYKEF